MAGRGATKSHGPRPVFLRRGWRSVLVLVLAAIRGNCIMTVSIGYSALQVRLGGIRDDGARVCRVWARVQVTVASVPRLPGEL
eukprot:1950549-Rhodomonas_salina.2